MVLTGLHKEDTVTVLSPSLKTLLHVLFPTAHVLLGLVPANTVILFIILYQKPTLSNPVPSSINGFSAQWVF